MIFEMQVISFFNYFGIQNAVSLKLIKYKLRITNFRLRISTDLI